MVTISVRGSRCRCGVRLAAAVASLVALNLPAPAAARSCLGTAVSSSSDAYLRAREKLDKAFRSCAVFDVDVSAAAAGLGKTRGGSLRLKLGDSYDWDLSLQPGDVRSAGYVMRVATRSGIAAYPRTPACTYAGYVNGVRGGTVRLSLSPHGITGFVTDRGKRVFVEPVRNFDRASPPSLTIAYTADDVLPDDSPADESDAVNAPASRQVESLGKARATTAAEPCKIAEIALAADYSMFEAYGSVEAVEARITGIMNLVNETYEDPRLGITHEMVEFYVEAEDLDTWGSSLDFSGNLSSLNSWSRGANGFTHPFDICSLWWYYPGGGTIGMAGIAVVCSQSRPGSVIRDYTKSTHNLMIDVAHELGHNWGANHIDDAADIMYPRVTGTNDEWTAATITAILRHKNTRTCIDGCDQPPLADFAVLDSTPCRGTVRFADKSRYSPQSWSWTFGDGATSAEQNPVHDYTRNGTYTVALTVANAFGADTATRTNYLTVNAPAGPVLATPACAGGTVTLSATASGTVRWYDTHVGGAPLSVGQSFTTPALSQATTYYVENGGAEFPVQTIGPADTAAGDSGAYKSDAGNIYMVFKALADLRFVSFTAYANKAGKRHFILTTNNLGTVVSELVTTLPVGRTVVSLNWMCAANKTYELILENTADASDTADGPDSYYNNLYRSRGGFIYPVSIPGLMSVTSNYYLQQNPGTTGGWYLGYDWRVQQVDPCASARIPVLADPSCGSTPAEDRHRTGRADILLRGSRCAMRLRAPVRMPAAATLFDVHGQAVRRWQIAQNGWTVVDLHGLARGTYLLRVTSATTAFASTIVVPR